MTDAPHLTLLWIGPLEQAFCKCSISLLPFCRSEMLTNRKDVLRKHLGLKERITVVVQLNCSEPSGLQMNSSHSGFPFVVTTGSELIPFGSSVPLATFSLHLFSSLQKNKIHLKILQISLGLIPLSLNGMVSYRLRRIIVLKILWKSFHWNKNTDRLRTGIPIMGDFIIPTP